MAWPTLAALALMALHAGLAARGGADAFLQNLADARFQYGEAWWWEPHDDETTSLLLRFGPPTERAVDREIQAAETVRQAQAEDDALFDLDAMLDPDSGPGGGILPAMRPEETGFHPRPVNEARATEGFVLDYGWNRREFSLPPDGPVITPDGRFGAGLYCRGKGVLTLPGVQYATPAQAGESVSVDFWLKLDAYPDATVCVWEVNALPGGNRRAAPSAGARLLLHPDGRLHLALLHPHGNPNRNHWSPEAYQAIFDGPGAVLYSRAPLPLHAWVHVQAYNDPPTVQGASSPMGVFLAIDGIRHAEYISEVSNDYNFMGRRDATWFLGNSSDGTQPFRGRIDEFRILNRRRRFYPTPEQPWRDPAAERSLAFGPPHFLADGAVFHASFDRGATYDFHRADPEATIAYAGVRPADDDAALTDGVRGRARLVDVNLGLPRFSICGMNARHGVLECWIRPDNFDNFTRSYQALPPGHQLSAARFYGRDRRDGQVKVFQELLLPRADSADGAPRDFHPGQWYHLALEWGHHNCVFLDGTGWRRYTRGPRELLDNIEPLYVEFGITDDVRVARGERPRIVVDEVVGYNYTLEPREVVQAMRRWQGEVSPLRLYTHAMQYKRRIGQLEMTLTAAFPPDRTPGQARVTLQAEGTRVGPTRATVAADGSSAGPDGQWQAPFAANTAALVLFRETALEPGAYRFAIELTDDAGETVVSDTIAWRYTPEWWLDCQAGLVDEPPPPWTPVRVDGNRVETRMTAYTLAPDGWPSAIEAAGENLLAAPVQLLEGDRPMRGEPFRLESATPKAAVWTGRFRGTTCDIEVRWICEYEGMVRHELRIRPKAVEVAPVQLVYPLHARYATRILWEQAEWQHAATAVTPAHEGRVWSARDDGLHAVNTRRRRANEPELTDAQYEGWHFCPVLNVNDRERGLFWFADHAAGWIQSPRRPTQALERQGDAIRLILNLIAEPSPVEADAPVIVFGLLPHPARPVPSFYRTLDRPAPDPDPRLARAFGSVFMPWPMDPRGGKGFQMYPAPDPENPAAGPSFKFAERCADNFRRSLPEGFRTMYLSKYWLSCRAGAYDGWEWRNGPMGAVTLNERFVEYLVCEMNEWIGRAIYNAIYVDENYPVPSRRLDAGQAIRLPDGSIQPGKQNWATRALFKRWRHLFHVHGRTPMLISHHTGSFPYHTLVFCDAYLDGEGRPTIAAQSRDFVDSVPLHRAEVLQNGHMWGVIPFYMVSIWEGGLAQGKDWNPHRVWSWRMARGAMSVLAHFENGATYTDQGTSVYQAYWRDVLAWGAGDLDAAAFIPYWRAAPFVTVGEPATGTLVSLYRKADGILLIVSNRTNDEQDVTMILDRAALGITGSIEARDIDSGFEPPPGHDIPDARALDAMHEEARQASQADPFTQGLDTLKIDIADLLGDGPLDMRPRVDGNSVSVRARGKDFRLIAIAF